MFGHFTTLCMKGLMIDQYIFSKSDLPLSKIREIFAKSFM